MTKFFKRTTAAKSLFLADTSAWHSVKIRICPDHKWHARRAGGGAVVGDRVSAKRELGCFAHWARLKVRKRHANKSNAFERWEYRSDKIESKLMQLLSGLDRHL